MDIKVKVEIGNFVYRVKIKDCGPDITLSLGDTLRETTTHMLAIAPVVLAEGPQDAGEV